MKLRYLLAIAVASFSLLTSLGTVTPRASAAPIYTITDIGTLPDGNISAGADINAAGQVVGGASTALQGAARAFVYRDGVMTNLGTLPGGYSSSAAGINNAGWVVGSANSGSSFHAALWRDGMITDLGVPPGYTYSDAKDINDLGQIAGTAANFPAGGGSATSGASFIWQDGKITFLGFLANSNITQAEAINNAGQVVGLASRADATHAFLYSGGSIADLGTLGGTNSSGLGINDAGQIVGAAQTAGNDLHPFHYINGMMLDLGTLPGYTTGGAYGINKAGQIVGKSGNPYIESEGHAFLYSGGVMSDLNTLIPPSSGWELRTAKAINDAGQIVGSGVINNQTHAYVLTPADTPRPNCGAKFPKTGKCLGGRFADYWQQHGGLTINGYPLTDEFTQILEDGKPHTVQYFERVRMEYHPDVSDPRYEVQLGQFGRTIHPADPAVAEAPGMTYFPETGHNVPPDFLAYWQANGDLAQFGLPLSEVFREKLEDGQMYEVQYFERARFERHPEVGPGAILLGQFGRRILDSR